MTLKNFFHYRDFSMKMLIKLFFIVTIKLTIVEYYVDLSAH